MRMNMNYFTLWKERKSWNIQCFRYQMMHRCCSLPQNPFPFRACSVLKLRRKSYIRWLSIKEGRSWGAPVSNGLRSLRFHLILPSMTSTVLSKHQRWRAQWPIRDSRVRSNNESESRTDQIWMKSELKLSLRKPSSGWRLNKSKIKLICEGQRWVHCTILIKTQGLRYQTSTSTRENKEMWYWNLMNRVSTRVEYRLNIAEEVVSDRKQGSNALQSTNHN